MTFGTRLPLFQGASFAFYPAIKAFMAQPEFACSSPPPNATAADAQLLSTEWMDRIAVIQASLLLQLTLAWVTVSVTCQIPYFQQPDNVEYARSLAD